MWISKAIQNRMDIALHNYQELRGQWMEVQGENGRLKIENARLRSDLDWFKLRLNQVEKERGMLIQSAIGVKIAVPEFVPTFNPDEALNPMNDPFKDLGGDGAMDGVDLDPQVDYSAMPGFGKR